MFSNFLSSNKKTTEKWEEEDKFPEDDVSDTSSRSESTYKRALKVTSYLYFSF
jgi:hypothetical protein